MISVDPGVHFCGVARWDVRSARLIYAWLHDSTATAIAPSPWEVGDQWIAHCEAMQKRGEQTPVRAKDLLQVNLAAGRVCGRYPVRYYEPATWKGGTPKKIMVQRMRRSLTLDELAIVDSIPHYKDKRGRDLRHNVFDAIQIGLRVLGRLR